MYIVNYRVLWEHIHMTITYGSLCTGMGSETLVWEPLGWTAKWFSEIDWYCCNLLRDKYPNIPNLGDMCQIHNPESVNLIVGGTPCQSFSINSSGGGFEDDRGRLSIVFTRIVAEVKPRWVVWENVPNVLRINSGQCFSAIVRILAECGYGWAYRILDLRWFGLPQGRQRLFLVGHLGDCRPAVHTLFRPIPSGSNHTETQEVRQEGMARVDGWTGDETPKRGIGVIPTLRASQGGEGVGIIEGNGRLRNLTIREWERLQGFPDNYSKCRWLTGKIKDRKRVIGNSFPPPILKWIGGGIDEIENGKDKG